MSEAATHEANPTGLAHQFEDIEQQREASSLGMWAFLVTEIMFFGGLFASYTIYRALHYSAFEWGSRNILEVKWGATNTAILICSSLTMAMAIRSAQVGKKKATTIIYLLVTMLFGAAFLFIKLYFEWRQDWIDGFVPGLHWVFTSAHPSTVEPGVQMFMCFYFFMTGLHALHMVVGLGLLTVLVIMAARGRFTSQYWAPLEISGLYWHFVDIVWIFLFPLLYLIGGRYH
ncbi:MAG TPA: cytochrome c oxidase subunit 3 family protein [Candidatus Acidoferrales bacterium]|nr:cytochrome c oxidase subunit 3 family protein [Candidatus Acidoferrales bacterium]